MKPENVIPFEEVQADIESKFIELELKVLTVMQFDFDYSFCTPFSFIDMFLETHFDHFRKQIPEDKLNFFSGTFYNFFA